ncbi:MAG: hypothetical protein KBT02_07420 [Treponema sp.]|nr:hypothetical protein [Candidatus Treponema caballi]
MSLYSDSKSGDQLAFLARGFAKSENNLLFRRAVQLIMGDFGHFFQEIALSAPFPARFYAVKAFRPLMK